MLETIQQLNDIGWMTVITVLVLVIALIPMITESWRNLLSSLGLISKKEIHENEQEERLTNLKDTLEAYQKDTHDRETTWHQQSIDIRDKLQKNQENMVDSMNAISQGLTDLKLELLNEKIERMRWRILDFATTLQNGHEAGTEQFRNVLDTYTEYEDLLEKLGKTNGLVDASISFIQHKYQDLLNGDEKHDNG